MSLSPRQPPQLLRREQPRLIRLHSRTSVSSSLSGTVLLLLPLLLLLLLTITLPPSSLATLTAAAAPLPATITNGTFTSVDGEIEKLSPTTLQVNTMLNTAAGDGLQESVFTAIRLTFSNTLLILLPTLSDWDTLTIPIHILIRDPKCEDHSISGGQWPSLYVEIRGVLSHGSSIAIKGGTIQYPLTFLDIPAGLMMRNSSNLIIEAGTYLSHKPNSAAKSNFVSVSGHLTIFDRSGLYIINNNLTGTNATNEGGSNWPWYLLNLASLPVNISTTSLLVIANNNLTMLDITKPYAYFDVLYTALSPWYLSKNATVTISNNIMTLSNMSCLYTLFMRMSFISTSPLSIDSGSTFSISDNTMTATSAYIGSSWVFQICHMASPVSVNGSSTFRTVNNVMTTSSLHCDKAGQWSGITMGSSPITIADLSTFDISRNTLLAINTTFYTAWAWSIVLLFAASPLFLHSGSAATFTNNQMIALNKTGAVAWSWAMFILFMSSDVHRTTISGDCSMSFNNNELRHILEADGLPVLIKLPVALQMVRIMGDTHMEVLGRLDMLRNIMFIDVKSPSLVSLLVFEENTMLSGGGGGEGVVRVARNAIINRGSILNVSCNASDPTNIIPSIQTCINSINGSLCKVITDVGDGGGGSFYNCALSKDSPTSAFLEGNISECTGTATSTNSETTTHTKPMTRSQDPTSTTTYKQPSSHIMTNTKTSMCTPTSRPSNTPSEVLIVTGATPTPPTPTIKSSPSTALHQTSQTSSQKTALTSHATPSYSYPSSTATVHDNTSVTSSRSTSTSNSMSLSQLPLCPSSPPPCPYGRRTLLGNVSTHLNITTTATPNVSECGGSDAGLSIHVPFSSWGDGQPFPVSVMLVSSLTEYFNPSFASPFDTSSASSRTFEGVLVATQLSPHPSRGGGGSLWMINTLTYTGPSSRSAQKIDIIVSLSPDSFSCRTNSPIFPIQVAVFLRAAPPIPGVISTVVDVAVGISVMVPSALVRAGMMKTLVGMLRCNEFDPNDEVGFISNPFGWAAGREELQYCRGSVLTALILMCAVAGIMTLAIVAAKVCGDGCSSTHPSTWADAVKSLRLPSLPLVVVLLLSEVCVASAISMLLYTKSTPTDILLSLATLFPLFVYMGVYVYQTAISSRYVAVEEAPQEEGQVTTKSAVDSNDENVDSNDRATQFDDSCRSKKTRRSVIGRIVRYLLEPTHDVVVLERRPRKKEGSDDDYDDDEGRGDKQEHHPRSANNWLRHNFYFVAERRWAVYGALEVVGGTLMNILEGIPLSTTSRALCVARPACVMIIAAILLVLLVWKIPNAVRLQQWCAIFVMGGMVLTGALATANAVSPSAGVELATGYIGAVVMGAAAILGMLEVAVLLLAYLPAIRDVLSLRSRSLQSVLLRSNTKESGSEDPLQVPMLTVSGRETPPLLMRMDSSDLETSSTPPSFVAREDTDSDQHPSRNNHKMSPEEHREHEAFINRQILAELEDYERTEQELQKHHSQNSFIRR